MSKPSGISVKVQKRARFSRPESVSETISSGPGICLSDLNDADKQKISKLVEKVFELGRDNESLAQELAASNRRREEDVLNAVSAIRIELQQKIQEVSDLQGKRIGALELLRRYQDKISELADSVRVLTRSDKENKAQIQRYKSELNNLQQILETQSQTINTYRLQVTNRTVNDSNFLELEDALSKRTAALKRQEVRTMELEENMQQLNEQITSIRSVLHSKDKQIAELNSLLLQHQTSSESKVAANPTAIFSSKGKSTSPKNDLINLKDKATDQYPSLPDDLRNSSVPDESDAEHFDLLPSKELGYPSKKPSTSWDKYKDENFISYLEKIALEKKKKLEQEQQARDVLDEQVISPPPRARTPPQTKLEGQKHVDFEDRLADEDVVEFDSNYSNSASAHTMKVKQPVKVIKAQKVLSGGQAGSSSGREAAESQNSKTSPYTTQSLQGAHMRHSTALSSGASTLMNTSVKGFTKDLRHSYSENSNSNANKPKNKRTEKPIKFGSHLANSATHKKVPNKSPSYGPTLQHGDNNYSVSSGSMYDSVLLDLVDELDSIDSNLTLSSIARSSDGHRW